MSDRAFTWRAWIGARPSGPVAARIMGARTILLERADAAIAAASDGVDERYAASLRGKAHAYREDAQGQGATMSAHTKHLSTDAYFAREYGNNLSDDFGSIPSHTEQQIHAARMQVALHGGPDVAEILAMLGLGEA